MLILYLDYVRLSNPIPLCRRHFSAAPGKITGQRDTGKKEGKASLLILSYFFGRV